MVTRNVGGLGGLGGMPGPAPQQPSGFSNFVQSPDFGNVMQSLGLSLMSSPSNAPLSSMPTILSGVQAQSMRQRQEQLAAEERQAQTEKANATRSWLETNQPDLVPIFDMDPGAAINALVERKKPQEQKDQALMNVGDGLIYDPNSREWIKPPEELAAQSTVNFDDVTGIRKEIQQLPAYKNYSQALPIYNAMGDAARRDTRASDLNLVYGLGKIMDPTSVVREGEMIMVQNTSSLPDWLVGQINALNGGASLPPETRKAIMQEAYGRMSSYDTALQSDLNQYRDMAGRYNINESDIIPNNGPVSPWDPAAQSGPRTTQTGVNWSY